MIAVGSCQLWLINFVCDNLTNDLACACVAVVSFLGARGVYENLCRYTAA